MGKKPLRLHALKRPKVRQDMKRENLYNLSRMRAFNPRNRTFFQQKWSAKSLTRAYHGGHIREKQWNRLFSRSAHAVVPMNPAYLAEHDGSDQAAGRGMGRQMPPGKEPRVPERTPYMQMTYHPMERRLDTAVFRALFASSVLQARQFVVHGGVKVNGKLMRFPGYMLNPGDMFQVEPDRVMFALGAKKDKWNTKLARKQLLEGRHQKKRANAETDVEQENEALLTEAQEELNQDDDSEESTETSDNDPVVQTRKSLKSIRDRTKGILENPKIKKALSAKLKQDLRALAKNLNSSISNAATVTPSYLDDLEIKLQTLSRAVASGGSKATASEEAVRTDESDVVDPDDTPEMQEAIGRIRENPPDPNKPYRTPWQPRDWMSAFAFIPRYLEVNQNICGAVYLRHPVCYPGFAEVPTPFNVAANLLAFNWYLRRR